MATDLELQYLRKREAEEAAGVYQDNAEMLSGKPPTPESEALEELPLGGITDPITKGVEEIGKVGQEVMKTLDPGLDVLGKTLGLDLPKGGLGKAVGGVLGTPSAEMTPGQAGVSTLAAGVPLAGVVGKAASKMLRLEHYSPKKHLASIDPEFAGTAAGAREKELYGETPMSFFYAEGTKPEARFKGLPKYVAEVDESTIAQGPIYEQFRAQYPDPKKRLEAVKAAGFKGWRDESQPTPYGQAVMMFEPVRPVHVPQTPKPLSTKEARTLAQDASQELYASGGSTHSLIEGNMRGVNAYAVAVMPEHRGYIPGNASPVDIQNWIEKTSKEVDLHDDMVTVGTWFDKENNRTEMSLSLVFNNQDDALAFARETGERAIYSLGSGQEVWVNAPKHMGEAGKVDVRSAIALAGALVGGAYGYNTAKPDENAVLETLKGAGLGALAPLAFPLARAIARGKLERATPGNAAALSPAERVSPLADIAKTYREAVDRYTRGVITHAESRAAGARKIAAGDISDEWIATRHPGATYNEAQIAAYKEYLLQEGEKLRTIATAFNQNPGNPALEESFLRQMAVYAKMDPLDTGLEVEAGRSLSYLNDVENEVNAFVRQMSGVVGKVRVTQSPKRMAEMVAATKSVEAIADFARITTAPGMGDMVVEAWINGLLSQPITHVTNAFSNVVTIATSIPERALAAGFELGSTGVVSREATALMRGYYQSVTDSWVAAGKAFKNDAPMFGAEKMETRKHSISRQNFNLALQRAGIDPVQGAWASGIDYLGNAARVPGRLLMASDEFFKGIAFNGEKAAQSWRHATLEATSEGLQGKALRTRINERYTEIMNDPKQWEAFRHEAEEFASYVTFTKDLGPGGQALQQIASHPLGKVVLPFVRTPLNIAKYAGERTPFAVFSKAVRTEIEAGGARRDLALAKIGAGSSAMTLMGGLAYSGVITGFGPGDKESRRLWQTDGRNPYSINVSGLKRLSTGDDPTPQTGDTWLGYSRTDPIGMLVGLAADYTDIITNLDDPEVADHLGARLTLVASHVVASKTYVKGISEWLFAAVDPEHYGGKLEESLSRTAITTIPIVGPAAKLVQRAIDPIVRETNGVMDSIKSTIPGLSSTLPPRVNYWGETVQREGWMAEQVLSPLYHSTHFKDPVVEKLVDARVNLTQPKNTIGKYELSGKENEYLLRRFGDVKLGGRTLHQEYERILDKLWPRTPEALRRDPQSLLHLELRRAEDVYKQAARNELYKAHPNVARAVGEEVTGKIESRKLLPPGGSNIRIQ